MTNEAYMLVLAIRLDRNWWGLPVIERKDVLSKVEETEKRFGNEFISLKKYASLSQGSQIIYWASALNTSTIIDFKASILSSFSGNAVEDVSLFSIFTPSPYMKSNFDPLSVLKVEPLKYFVAYPMKKSVDWYLLPFDEREKIMMEHINMAKNHPKNDGIRSYTTYSFGLGDYEFVVIYELPSLPDWVEVVEKLREAKARKWVIKEEPLLVGELKDQEFLLY